MSAFVVAPTVIASALAGRLVVDLFVMVLPDVRDDERAVSTAHRIVEAEAPRVAQAERPDLVARGNRNVVDERVVWRDLIADRVLLRHVYVDPEHLSEEAVRVLGVVEGIVGATAITQADVQ